MTENNQSNLIAETKKTWIAPALVEEAVSATKGGVNSTFIAEGFSYHS